MEKNLANLILEKSNITSYNFADEKKGLKLNHIIYRHPFGLRAGIIVMADYVASDEGTGVVHTAPGYGTEDFYTGKKYKLDIVMQVDNQGCFYKDIPEFGGLHVRQANSAIIEKLNTLGLLLHKGEIIHSYPHCWRCKNAIIFRATEQWFMHIDHNELRKRTLTAIKKVAWFPKFGENRIASMVENRPDWCLSRQRLWGVPIPVFYCKQCNFAILDKGLIDNFAKIVEKEGTDSWFISSIEDLLPTGYLCPKCKKKDFIQEKDILDVWFDSGVSAQAVLKANKDLAYPADLYLEGSDQHRGWFQAALLPAMAIDDFSPFKAVLTHGFVVDGEGKKMSKSLGNVIAPQEVIAKLGADVLRLWVAFSDYNDDVRISDEILNRISEGYRKIRNTLKFMLGNLFDFDPEKDSIAYSELMEIDRWALSVLHSLRAQVKIAYDNYVFHQAVKLIYNFCVVQMSSFYLDVLKDRLYTFTKKSKARRSAQTAIYQILLTITKMIAPILSFTAEEAYSLSCGQKEESIFLTQWPTADKTFIDIKLERTWNLLLDTRNFVLKELEIARSNKIIGNSLEAKVIIFYSESNPEIAALLKKHHQQLASIFLTSQVQLKVDIDRQELPIYNISLLKDKMSTTTAPIKIKIERAEGNKCIRCWNYSLSVGEDDKHRNLCARCISNLAGKE